MFYRYLLLGVALNLTHWGRVTHICVSKLTIIGSDNGLSPGRRQAIIWTNAGIMLIRPLGTNFSEMLIAIVTCSFMKMRLKVSSAKWRPFCLDLNVLNWYTLYGSRGVTTRLYPIFVEVRHVLLLCVDVISYPCTTADEGLANLS